jgi:DNA-binding FadR family transcriptional regulator
MLRVSPGASATFTDGAIPAEGGRPLAPPENRLTSPAANRRVPKISEIVASELRQKILRGTIKAGEPLSPESVLVTEYNVSRPSLREAMRLLESQGLVAIRRGSHRGPLAATPDLKQVVDMFTMHLQLRKSTVADVYQFRMLLEPRAVRIAAERASAADIEVLKNLLTDEKEAIESGTAFTEIAWRFHTELMRLSGNDTVTLIAEMLETISARHASAMLMGWDDQQDQRERAYRAHRRMVGLIERGEADKAEQFWAKHMAEVGKRLVNDREDLSVIELLD